MSERMEMLGSEFAEDRAVIFICYIVAYRSAAKETSEFVIKVHLSA
tara:strand:+ start:1713 stop:1850 length:138 start_codon:yes stop_codon:yes gene_type:complete